VTLFDAYADDDLSAFEEHGARPLPEDTGHGFVRGDGAAIWYATYGWGPPVVMLHGGLGHSGNWGFQVPVLVAAGYRVITIDTRGHGRSTRDTRPYTYELLASDVEAVMDPLRVERAALVGWSDGACTALILAMQSPARVSGVFYFGCNMDPSGTLPMSEPPPIVLRCFKRHSADYARLSETPDRFDEFVAAVTEMQRTQPNASAQELEGIDVPVTIVHAEHDEFIRLSHAEYLARTIPGAEFVLLEGVSHFAPLQRPRLFSDAVLGFLANRIRET
jgi:pimeloyl-ACP methyl ester carboxylesterase